MRQNPARRAALLDAAIEVLAAEGSRGLTLRAVDAKAQVPVGTCSNYFANRAELLRQIMERTRERLTPDPAEVAEPWPPRRPPNWSRNFCATSTGAWMPTAAATSP